MSYQQTFVRRSRDTFQDSRKRNTYVTKNNIANRWMGVRLDLIGAGFRHHNADGITMDRGAEGLTLHGSASSLNVRSNYGYQCQNGVMANGVITVMYQLADINAGDGGL